MWQPLVVHEKGILLHMAWPAFDLSGIHIPSVLYQQGSVSQTKVLTLENMETSEFVTVCAS